VFEARPLYISEDFGQVRKLGRDGIITRVASVPGGVFTGVAVDPTGTVYLASRNRVRKLDAQG
jgi:hypothetical protein